MALTKPPVLPVWADTGDKTQPADVEIQAGWPVSNIPPARQRFNWFFNFCANAVRYLTRRGIPDWAADETYLIGDRTQWTDGKTYVSLANANINFPPGTNPGVWDTWGVTGAVVAGFATQAQVQNNNLVYVAGGGTANAHTATYTPAVTALTDGMVLEFKAANANTGAATFSPNGIAANPIVGGAHSALQGGEIAAGGMVELMYHAGLASWVLLGCTGGALQVGTATQSQHAVTLAQAQAIGTPAMQQYFFGQL